jgi:hypothetical protein
MFGLTKQEIERSGAAGMVKFLEEFDADTEVWEGDARDILIGDGDELDEDDAAQYRLIGTCGDLAQQYRDLVAAAKE